MTRAPGRRPTRRSTEAYRCGNSAPPLWFGIESWEEYAMAGDKDKAKGSLKEAAGKVTDDRQTEVEGKTDRAKGEVKDAAHDVKESAKGVRDSLKKD